MAMSNDSPDELGWFGSAAVRKVKKTAKKAVQSVQPVARKVYKPIAAVERVVRPIGKKVPIVGTFAQLHEDITEPLERRVLGLKGKAQKTKAEKLATLVISSGADVASGLKAKGLPSTPQAVKAVQGKAAAQLKAIAGTSANAGKMFDLATKARAVVAAKKGDKSPVTKAIVKAAISRAPVTPGKLAAAASLAAAVKLSPTATAAAAVAKPGFFVVLTPEGKRVEIPAGKVR